MNRFENPFTDLWITERLNPNEFVKMFSPVVAEHAQELFSTGNIIVRGRQGSGKSMLLGLLATQTRVAYAREKEPYPCPKKIGPFIAAGTNLIRDNVQIVANRLGEVPEGSRDSWLASTFSDYLNYLLIEDLFKNVIYLANEQKIDSVLSSEICINLEGGSKNKLVAIMRKHDAFFGYFSGCDTFESLSERVSDRLVRYRRYFNFNTADLNAEVAESRTSIAEPIAVFADSLREAGIVPLDTTIYLRIDQHEELHALERKMGMKGVFRQVINRAIAMRDRRVCYRVGTRHYAWTDELTTWGSGAPLENLRDYNSINIDDILQRKENYGKDLFPNFANDVLIRRLKAYKFEVAEDASIASKVFGRSPSANERAKSYAKGQSWSPSKVNGRHPSWNKFLRKMWEQDPLSAKLGDAWLRQDAQTSKGIDQLDAEAVGALWMEPSRQWWRKERNEVALMQIAGEASQSMTWSGERQLIDLAGYNILAFMSICQRIWAAWLRVTPEGNIPRALPTIGRDSQVIGVLEASLDWREKIGEGADGEARKRLVSALGSFFSKRLRKDKAITYPGHNGISILMSEFESGGEVVRIIRECRDHGDLIESDHTTKNSDAKPRIKWYLNPILCPAFRIPYVRTKEPIYTSVKQIESLISGKSDIVPEPSGEEVAQIQRNLFS